MQKKPMEETIYNETREKSPMCSFILGFSSGSSRVVVVEAEECS